MICRMKALSIRQPWAWLILHAGKDIENRHWQSRNPALHFRGRCLLHAGLAADSVSENITTLVSKTIGLQIPAIESLPRGGIVGEVDVIDVVQQSASPWFVGPWGLVLANPISHPFTPCRGRLGFFDPHR